MKKPLGIAAVLLAMVCGACAEEGWIPLFNGKDLDGWTPKIRGRPLGENYAHTFRVEDGLLKVRYDEYPGTLFKEQFGHLFFKTPFSNYLLRVEYRFVGEQCPDGPGWAIRNSGAMIHGQTPETMALNQEFPVSIEVQILGGLGKGPRSTGNLCTPGTLVVLNGLKEMRHCIDSASKTFDGDQWVTLEVEAHGNGRIIHRINGEQVMAYEKSQYDPSDREAKLLITGTDTMIHGGTISLQSESHPVDFRKVELKPLE